MEKVAIDIVLLPSVEMMDKSIEVNKEMLKTYPNIIILDKEKCVPHISLLMGVIERDKLASIEIIVQEIANKISIFNLTANEIDMGKLPNGDIVPGFKIKNIPELQKLHETIMNKIKPHCTYDATANDCFTPSEVNEGTIEWINRYPVKAAYEDFNPHITLGFGQVDSVDYPINFKAAKLAICQLGNYCTCRKVLASVDLK